MDRPSETDNQSNAADAVSSLRQNLSAFRNATGMQLDERWAQLDAWYDDAVEAELFQFFRAHEDSPGVRARVLGASRGNAGRAHAYAGMNFACYRASP